MYIIQKIIFVTIVASVGFISSAGAHEFSDAQKNQIQDVVREWMIKNPEILIEVQDALFQKQTQQAINQNKNVIFESSHQAVIGNKNPKIKIVEFFDYNCGFCKRAMDDMNNIIRNNPDVQFIMKELPVLGEESVEAAKISTAVYRLYPQEYQNFHQQLLNLNGTKNAQRAIKIVQNMKMDVSQIENEANSEMTQEAINEVRNLARELRATGTPTYVIGNEVIHGAVGEITIQNKINNMRKCGDTNCS